MDDHDPAVRFAEFLKLPSPVIIVEGTRFKGDSWEVSGEQQTFVWPEAQFLCNLHDQAMRPAAIRSSTDLAQASADGYSLVSTTAPRMPRYADSVPWW